MITLKTDADRLPTAAAFALEQIRRLDSALSELDYSEDVYGVKVYTPSAYEAEKQPLRIERRRWEVLYSMLTEETPVILLDD